MASQKMISSPAVDALGLGEQLKQQTQNAEIVRRKKKLMAAAQTGDNQEFAGSPAAAMLYGKAML